MIGTESLIQPGCIWRFTSSLQGSEQPGAEQAAESKASAPTILQQPVLHGSCYWCFASSSWGSACSAAEQTVKSLRNSGGLQNFGILLRPSSHRPLRRLVVFVFCYSYLFLFFWGLYDILYLLLRERYCHDAFPYMIFFLFPFFDYPQQFHDYPGVYIYDHLCLEFFASSLSIVNMYLVFVRPQCNKPFFS